MKKDLRILEQEGLIKVYQTTEGNKVVDGRELWEGLGVKQKFADWIKNNLNSVDAVEDIDFTSFPFKVKTENTYITTTEYILTLDVAKEICMICGAMPRANEELKKKSKEYRKYLINIENKYKQAIIKQPSGLEPQVLQLAQGMQLIGQVVQGIQNTMANIQEFVADSINAKDFQIEQTAEMIGLRSKNTMVLTELLKEKLSNLIGRKIMANNDLYIKIKNKIFRKYKVIRWEDIPISKFNSVYADIDGLEKDDLSFTY